MNDRLAHVGQYGFGTRKCRIRAADHEGQGAGICRGNAARNGCINHVIARSDCIRRHLPRRAHVNR